MPNQVFRGFCYYGKRMIRHMYLCAVYIYIHICLFGYLFSYFFEQCHVLSFQLGNETNSTIVIQDSIKSDIGPLWKKRQTMDPKTQDCEVCMTPRWNNRFNWGLAQPLLSLRLAGFGGSLLDCSRSSICQLLQGARSSPLGGCQDLEPQHQLCWHQPRDRCEAWRLGKYPGDWNHFLIFLGNVFWGALMKIDLEPSHLM